MTAILPADVFDSTDAEVADIPVEQQVKAFRDMLFVPVDIIEGRMIHPGTRDVRKFWFDALELAAMLATMSEWNARGYNIYIGANARRAHGISGDDNVLSANSIFADCDGANGYIGMIDFQERIRAAGLPTPGALVSSGHGGWAFWLFIEPMIDLAAWRDMQVRLAAILKTDTTVINPERIIRVPGFINWKPPTARAWLWSIDSTIRYTVATLDAALPAAPKTPTKAIPMRSGNFGGNEELLRRARFYLAKIPPAQVKARNSTVFSAAGHVSAIMTEDGETLGESDVLNLIRGFNMLNDPPLDDAEVVTTVQHARKYKTREPKPPTPRNQLNIRKSLSLRRPETTYVNP